MVIGFLLLPIAGLDYPVLTGTISFLGFFYYDLLLVIICVEIAKQSSNAFAAVTAQAWFLRAAGLVVGGFLGTLYYDLTKGFDAQLSLVALAMFLIMTFATFWLIDDKKAKTLWGLTKKLDANIYNEKLLEEKCQALSKAKNLKLSKTRISPIVSHKYVLQN